ncbi:MAG: DNA translocase FtsK 4TM domain-containing protein, partial [Bacteroidota bacterium]
MARKTKRKTKAEKKAREQRLAKISGVLFGLLGIYLLLAFVSYFFTWQVDQDAVLRLSWSILFDGSVTVTNWLGRLGAVVSNLFFYWGFGVGSLLFVPLLFHIGYQLIKQIPIVRSVQFYQQTFLVICFISILSAFIFQNFGFPWGGTFGNNICYWLSNFVGQVGLSILILFSIISWVIWRYNPAVETLSLRMPAGLGS